jgi:hypothetical protein
MNSQDLGISGHLLGVLESLNAEASRKAAGLQRSLDSVTHIQKTLTDLLAALLDQRVFLALDLVEKECEGLAHFFESLPQASSIFGDLESQIGESARRAWLDYPKMMEDACHGESLCLDPRSRHPNYKFTGGFLVVKVRRQGKTARAVLRSNERKIAEFPADVRTVVERVKKEEQRLFGRHCDVERLLREIRRHYMEILEEHQLPDGSPVELRGLANRLIKGRRGYRIDEFIVDLSRLAREGSPEIDGRRLELRSTRDDEKGMLLHDLAGLGYVGSLRFSGR